MIFDLFRALEEESIELPILSLLFDLLSCNRELYYVYKRVVLLLMLDVLLNMLKFIMDYICVFS
jgi:hypothetical protein